MADILIRGMEMPTKENQVVLITPNGEVWLMANMPCDTKHLTRAKAIELPEHGDLIDRDVARDKIAEQETSYYMDMDGVDNGLLETPVIVPASKEETE